MTAAIEWVKTFTPWVVPFLVVFAGSMATWAKVESGNARADVSIASEVADIAMDSNAQLSDSLRIVCVEVDELKKEVRRLKSPTVRRALTVEQRRSAKNAAAKRQWFNPFTMG